MEELVGFMMRLKAVINIINGEHRRRKDTKREKKEQIGKEWWGKEKEEGSWLNFLPYLKTEHHFCAKWP